MNKADSLKIWKPAYEFRKEESWLAYFTSSRQASTC